MPDPVVTLGPRGLHLAPGQGAAGDSAKAATGPIFIPFLAGAMHHFRLAPSHHSACLRGLRAMGYRLVETAAPWNLGEPARGEPSASGDYAGLPAFLDACAAEGLYVVVRVGPRVGGELDLDGLPARIVADTGMQARTGTGRPAWVMDVPRAYPAPSYSSHRFLEEVGAHYRALGAVLAPRLFPAGPVVALEVDHALGGFQRAGAFDADYHAESLARWHAEEGPAPPPTRFTATSATDLVPSLRWLAFRERSAVAALRALSGLLDAAGLVGVPRLHGFAPVDPVVYDVAAAERVIDAAGIEVLDGASGWERIARRARYLAGNSRLPRFSHLALGAPPWGPPRTDADGLNALLVGLMHGVAGYTGHMAVARDRWLGAPLEENGVARPGLAVPLTRLHAVLGRAAEESDRVVAKSSAGHADVGVFVPRDYARLGLASSRLGPIAHLGEWLDLEDIGARSERFGLAAPLPPALRAAEAAVGGALDEARLPYVLADESTGDARLFALRLLVVLTFDFVSDAALERIRAFAARGGIVLFGPRTPNLDGGLLPVTRVLPGEWLPEQVFADRPALALRLVEAATRAGCTRGPSVSVEARAAGKTAESSPGISVAEQPGPGGGTLLYVHNRERSPLAYSIELPEGTSGALDVLADSAARIEGGRLVGTAAPRSASVFLVEGRARDATLRRGGEAP